MPKAEPETIETTEEPRRGKPPKNKPPKAKVSRSEGGPTFWQRVNAIAKADWGPRANIYLYRVEPIIDRLRGSEQKYIMKYPEPISEDRVLADHGSGRYKAVLNFRKPAADQGDEVDSIYIDLLNLQYPPKVPPGEWVDDPRNKRWAWAKQAMKEETQQGSNKTDLIDALAVLNDVQKSAVEQFKKAQPEPVVQPSATQEFKNIVDVLDRVRPPAAPPDNTLPAFMQAELASIRLQVEKSREREIALMEKLIEVKTKPNENAGGLGVVKELVGGLKDLLPSVKDLFPGLADGAAARSRLGPWQELAVAVTPHVTQIVSPFANVFAQLMAMKIMGNGQPQPHMNGAPGVQQPPAALPNGQPQAGTMMPFLQMIALPMLNYVRMIGPPVNAKPEELAADFASWVYDGYSADPRYEQAITAARSMGVIGLLAAFRGTPLWTDKGPTGVAPSLAELDIKFQAFLKAFLEWKPEDADVTDAEEDEEDVPKVVNFDEKYQEA